MARTATNPLATPTAGTEFTGSQYAEYLEIRKAAMKGHAEGTVDDATKNAARAVVRNARNAIKRTGMSVDEWRAQELTREAELAESRKRARKPRAKKAATESTTPEVTEPVANAA